MQLRAVCMYYSASHLRSAAMHSRIHVLIQQFFTLAAAEGVARTDLARNIRIDVDSPWLQLEVLLSSTQRGRIWRGVSGVFCLNMSLRSLPLWQAR